MGGKSGQMERRIKERSSHSQFRMGKHLPKKHCHLERSRREPAFGRPTTIQSALNECYELEKQEPFDFVKIPCPILSPFSDRMGGKITKPESEKSRGQRPRRVLQPAISHPALGTRGWTERPASSLGRIDIYTLQLGFYLLKWKYVAKPL